LQLFGSAVVPTDLGVVMQGYAFVGIVCAGCGLAVLVACCIILVYGFKPLVVQIIFEEPILF
jgi:hypothetical protein